VAACCFAILARVERRAPDPVVPLPLFSDRLFAVACIHGLLAGCAMFGSTAYIPLFVQAVLGTSATAAGATLTPMLLAWVLTSIVSSRLLLRVSYRSLALTGMTLLTVGSFLLWQTTATSGRLQLLLSIGLMGSGMGFSIPAFLIAVQSSVPRNVLGTATSAIQFTRSIGGTIGVSIMGLLLSWRLAAALVAGGLDPHSVTLDRLLDPPLAEGAAAGDEALRAALATAMEGVFLIALLAAALGLLATFWTPSGNMRQIERRETVAEESLPERTPAQKAS
jgi:MFS family permease